MLRVLSAFACLALMASLAGAEQLDQEYSPSEFDGLGEAVFDARPDFDTFQELAQTFVVGLSGELVGVDLHLEAFGDNLIFELRGLENSVPDDKGPLYATEFTSDDIYEAVNGGADFFRIRLDDATVNVAAGDELAIYLRSDGFDGFAWSDGVVDAYQFGHAVRRSEFTSGWQTLNADFVFRTFVSVPEPSSLALLALSAAGIVLRCLMVRR